jgi:hypothetical protein
MVLRRLLLADNAGMIFDDSGFGRRSLGIGTLCTVLIPSTVYTVEGNFCRESYLALNS